MNLLDLPLETLEQIVLIFFLEYPGKLIPLLLTHPILSDLAKQLLYTHIRFYSTNQLSRLSHFLSSQNANFSLRCRPKSISIELPGGSADFQLFPSFELVIKHILRLLPAEDVKEEPTNRQGERALNLQCLRFRLNSHSSDENDLAFCRALEMTNPETFIWTGPDPDHHFSLAIVSRFAIRLCQAIESWTRLRHLKLTNVSAPRGYRNGHLCGPSLFSAVSSQRTLETLYIGRSTQFNPVEIARIACAEELVSLKRFDVVDAYEISIWGPRVKQGDVEKAVMEMDDFATAEEMNARSLEVGIEEWLEKRARMGDNADVAARRERGLERVKKLVSCRGETERIIGRVRASTSSRISIESYRSQNA